MSAYMVDKATIRYIVDAASRFHNGNRFSWWDAENRCRWTVDASIDEGTDILPHGVVTADWLGRLLLEENRKSVAYRYNDDPDMTPDGCAEYRHRMGHWPMDPVQVIKSIHCLDYQSCEHPEWHDSQARMILRELLEYMTGFLPGYDDAVWGAPSYAEVVRELV